jgi:nucleotide-binding universal stress UspA family protein
MSTSIVIKKILVPIDGSDLSFKAACYALHLAKMENAELTALNVVEDIKQGGSIGEYAEKNNLDLIVIGSKGRSKLKRLLTGGVANVVVNNATSPVLVVR